jgi:Tfp pilus assembly pilus retraction ATPase PilT
LKAFLRQDPDIIMVGEIRDYEVGEIAVEAALNRSHGSFYSYTPTMHLQRLQGY